MATAGGPHIKRDGLVFGYDTGYGVADNTTSTLYYPGKPTENLLALAGADSDLERAGQAPSYTYFGVDITSYVQSRWSTSNNILVQSFEGKRDYVGGGTGGGNDGYPRMYVYFSDWSWSSSFGISTYDWSYNSQTFTMPDPTGKNVFMNIYHMNSQNPGISYSRNHSVSFDTIDVPYTNGSRSSTQSLIDLTKTTNIDVSNVSFDSTGQPTFDGTDDILNTGLLSGRNPTTDPFTIESIVKSDTTSGARMWLDATSNGTNQRLYCAHAATGTGNPMGIQNSAWSSSGVQDTNFHHYVIVMDGSTATLYNNGVLHSTKSYSSYEIQALNVGGRAGYYWNGSIPVFKLYDDVLTAQEVQQNYNAYKNRFNI